MMIYIETLFFSKGNIGKSTNRNKNLKSEACSGYDEINFSFFNSEDSSRKMREHTREEIIKISS